MWLGNFLLFIAVAPGPGQGDRAREVAQAERAAVQALLKRESGLELSETKTLVTPVTKSFAFLGHHICVRRSHGFKRVACVTVIPKERTHQLRERIKRLCRRHRIRQSLHDLLRDLNWLLRRWSTFYRHAWGAKRVFGSIDYYAWWCVFRWLRKKHQQVPVRTLRALYQLPQKSAVRSGQWHHRGVTLFITARTPVGPFSLANPRPPLYALHHGEPGA